MHFLCSLLFLFLFLLPLFKIPLTLHKPRYRVQRNLPLISLLRAHSLVRIPRMRRQEMLPARHLPLTLSFFLSPYLHLPLLRERRDVSDRFFLHAHRPQQLLQRALLHVHERTPVALLPRRPHLHHRRARQRVQRHSSALQAVQIPDVVRVLPRELLHRQLRRELLLPERQRALHAQTDPPQEPAQLLAAVVEEMVRAAEMQVHRAHAQRERPTRQLGVTLDQRK